MPRFKRRPSPDPLRAMRDAGYSEGFKEGYTKGLRDGEVAGALTGKQQGFLEAEKDSIHKIAELQAQLIVAKKKEDGLLALIDMLHAKVQENDIRAIEGEDTTGD